MGNSPEYLQVCHHLIQNAYQHPLFNLFRTQIEKLHIFEKKLHVFGRKLHVFGRKMHIFWRKCMDFRKSGRFCTGKCVKFSYIYIKIAIELLLKLKSHIENACIIAENTTVKRSSAISKHVSFWAGQIPAGQTSPKGTISEMAARAFYCCLYAMHNT